MTIRVDDDNTRIALQVQLHPLSIRQLLHLLRVRALSGQLNSSG